MIPHFKLRLPFTAFCGLPPPHPHLPLFQPYTDLSRLSTSSCNMFPSLLCRILSCGPLPWPPRSLLKMPSSCAQWDYPALCAAGTTPPSLRSQAAHDGPLHGSPHFIAYASLSAFCTSYLAPWVEDGSLYPPTLPCLCAAHRQHSIKILSLFFNLPENSMSVFKNGSCEESEEWRWYFGVRFGFRSKLCWVLALKWLPNSYHFLASPSSLVQGRQ